MEEFGFPAVFICTLFSSNGQEIIFLEILRRPRPSLYSSVSRVYTRTRPGLTVEASRNFPRTAELSKSLLDPSCSNYEGTQTFLCLQWSHYRATSA
jgi:hypothetical protein